MTIHLQRLAGLSAEIFADKPVRVSRFIDTLQTCHMFRGRILKDSSKDLHPRVKILVKMNFLHFPNINLTQVSRRVERVLNENSSLVVIIRIPI